MEAQRQQMTSEGARMEPDELGIELDGLRTPQFDALLEKIESLKEAHQAVHDEFGYLQFSDEDRHFRFNAVWVSPPRFQHEDHEVSWETLQMSHEPVRNQWEECFDLIRHSRVLYHPAYGDGVEFQVEDLSPRLDFVKATIDLVYLDIQTGRLDKAIKRLEAIDFLRSRLRIDETSTLIDTLVFITTDAMQGWAVAQLLEHPELTPEQLQILREMISKTAASRHLLVQAMEGERVLFGATVFKEMRKQPVIMLETVFQFSDLTRLLEGDNTPFWEKVLTKTLTFLFCYGYYLPFCLNIDEAHYQNSMWNAERKFREYAQRNLTGVKAFDSFGVNNGGTVYSRWERPYITIFSRLAIPALNGAAERMIYSDVQQQLCRVAIEITSYRLQNKKLPETLADLNLPEEATMDPMTLEPLIYRNYGDGNYELYSRGPNGKDDGGEAFPKKNEDGRTVKEFKAPDWLWPRPIKN